MNWRPKLQRRSRRHWLHARLALALALTALLLRLLGAQRASRIIFDAAERLKTAEPFRGDPLPLAHSLSTRIDAVARGLPGKPRCLTRSLLLAGLLRRHGIAATLRVGVDMQAGFAAHAWVDVSGTSVGEGEDRYRPLWASGNPAE